MKLSIKDHIGPHCIIKEDGQKIYEAIHDVLEKGETVILDFKGVNQFASPFFNFAIGQLLKDIAEADLRRLLQIEHLNETGRLVVERVIENAAKYHSDKDYRKIVDDILEKQVREFSSPGSVWRN
jgi:hypothetical protein